MGKPNRPPRGPDNDPVLAHVIQRRNVDRATWSEIGRELRLTSVGAQQMYGRYYESIGEVPPVTGKLKGQAVVYPGDREPEGVRHPGPTIQPGLGDGPVPTIAGAGLTQLSANAHKITIPAERHKGWEKWMLATSDHHFDSTQCDRELLEYHHELARERDAGIVCLGDALDLMQGRQDKRAGKIDLRPEYQTEAYADAIVDDAAAWYGRYATDYWMMSYGNHESGHRKYQETDLLARLVRRLNRDNDAAIMLGAYRGRLNLDCDFGHDDVQRIRGAYHHGHGGGGPVTVGTIGAQRARAAGTFDLWMTGHVHERWALWSTVADVDEEGYAVYRDVLQVCCGPYKTEGLGGSGYHDESGRPPKPAGGWWIRLYYSPRAGRVLVGLQDVER